MKRFIATALFVFLPVQGFAKDSLRKYRHAGSSGQSRNILEPNTLFVDMRPAQTLLKGVGEFVSRESQTIQGAKIAGTWKQTILRPSGEVAYEAGAVDDSAPLHQEELQGLQSQLADALQYSMQSLAELKSAGKIFPPVLEVRRDSQEKWEPYWRVEYLSPRADKLLYLFIGKDGQVLERGQLDWDGVDGRAYAYPKGEKYSEPQEVKLFDLNSSGTVSGRILNVVSELGLTVWSPEFNFFFAKDDRRFDLGQAYYTIDQGYRWLKSHLGIELNHPIEVRLHVGNNGVSNAAFYHSNTIYLGSGDGELYRNMLRDPTVLIHESIHAVIDAYAGLPSQGEGGGFNEGFADLFTALILDNPRMGDSSYIPAPYRRTLENQLQAYKDFAPGVYQNGTVVASTFWDMKNNFGNELTAKLAFRTLVRLGSGAKFDDFPDALTNAADGLLNPEQKAFALKAAAKRGWKVAP